MSQIMSFLHLTCGDKYILSFVDEKLIVNLLEK